MFPFIYTFKRTIITDKTPKNVIDTVRDSLIEKKVQDILYTNKTVYFDEGFLKARSNNDYLAMIDNGKFIYDEESRVLTYKVKLWRLNIIAIVLGIFTCIYFDGFFGKSIPFLGLIVNHLFSYFGSQGLINEISHKLNYL
ncbi:hypothetical protein QFZ37_003231 [Chryseobacterium ginsenosidimutans]|uniref:hypothetical protein n=1 Tax=Chryseobacterium ginsenosidimutans TaxID=687846 RepID=UPI00278021F7|nr:hypothetical protein [Chryseobacterium ginsenosidimutans]MDQ0594862.1 hypothetical protein [Chryseobacterium ginsenosidimutans]